MKQTMSIDCETNGLYGPILAIAGIVYEGDKVVSQFCGRLPMSEFPQDDGWVAKHVTMACAAIKDNYLDDLHLLAAFAQWYKANKADTDIIAHMPCPVEAGLFILMNKAGLIGDFEGPYPLIDVAALLMIRGHDPLSVDKYLAEIKIDITQRPECGEAMKSHHPMYDAVAAAVAYNALLQPPFYKPPPTVSNTRTYPPGFHYVG